MSFQLLLLTRIYSSLSFTPSDHPLLHAYSFDTIDADSVLAVQAGLLDYVKREYTQGQAEGQHICQFFLLEGWSFARTLLIVDPF